MKAFWKENRWHLLTSLVSLSVIGIVLWEVYGPVPTPPPAAREEVVAAQQLGLDWLMNNFDDGLFLYEFDPESDYVPAKSNALRQLMASRVVAHESVDVEQFRQIHAENIGYVLSEWYQEDAEGGYVLFKEKSKLGANAMLLRTLAASPAFDQYAHEAKMTAYGMIELQNEDGSFNPWYVAPSYEYDAQYLLYFYSGEAILALLEYYEKTGDEGIYEAAEKAADYYLATYVDAIDENYHPAYVPWHTQAYAKLFALTGDKKYTEAVYTMNDRLLALLDTRVHPGRFYQRSLESEGQSAPHSSSDGVYAEGLLYAYELARDGREVERAEQYKKAITLSITRLVNLQYKAADPLFIADSDAYIGGIPIRESNLRIRVDTVQHALDAFEKYLAIFGE